MPEYDNNMRGVLFKNDRKEKDTHPDYKGQSEVNGVEYWLSAWIKTDKNGNKFMSLSFQAKDEAKPQQKPAPQSSTAKPSKWVEFTPPPPEDNENIPF